MRNRVQISDINWGNLQTGSAAGNGSYLAIDEKGNVIITDLVTTPGSSTDNAIVRFNGTGGSSIQDSAVTIDDSGILSASAITTALLTVDRIAGKDIDATSLYARNTTDDGTTKIPDVIVHFPDKDGQRDVVIDSKVSLTAWDEYVNSDDENIKEDALKRHKKSIKDHIDSLTKKNYQKELGINSLDGVIMFCPNEAAISSLGNSSRLMMEYAIQKKITLVGPAMLYFTLKTVEYYWRAEKQSKNTQQVIKLAEDIGSISIKVYEGAKKSVESIKKTSDGIDEVMNKIKDGRGSLLGKVNKMEKVGGIAIKESQKIPQESKIDEVE